MSEGVNFLTYIVKISKDVNDDVGVRKNVKELLDKVLKNMIKELVKRGQGYMKKRKVLLESDIENAIKEYLPQNKVRDMIVNEANNVIKDFIETKSFDLLMSLPRTRKIMMLYMDEGNKISQKAAIFLTAGLEQVIIELTEAANEYSKKKERNNITLSDLERAVKKDAELKEFMEVVNG